MITIHKRLPVGAAADTVWMILGDLSRAPEYVPGIVKVKRKVWSSLSRPDPNAPVSEVTVCDSSVRLVHVTVAPLSAPVFSSFQAVSLVWDRAALALDSDTAAFAPDGGLEKAKVPVMENSSIETSVSTRISVSPEGR